MSKPPLPTVGADPAPIGPATPAPGGPANPDRPAAEPAVREVKPTIYYLRDKDGNLVPVPGFSFEDFERLLRLDRKLAVPDTPPRYSLQKFSASGVVEGERAILRIDVTVALRDAEWVRIPLRCETALLREPVSVSGGADSAATFEREGDGYVVWLKGPVDKPQTLSLQVLVPILPVTDGQRLALAVPKSASSELKLKVPGTQITASVSAGGILLKPTVLAEQKQTELSVLGLDGDFQLTWRDPPAEQPTALEVTASQLVTLEGPDSLVMDAWLKVRGFGQPIDRFRVKAPPGVKVEPQGDEAFTVAPLPGDGENVYEVRMARPTLVPSEIHLVGRWTRPAGEPERMLDITGFEVLGAARQAGHVALSTEGDWTLKWGEQRHVQRVDELPEPLKTLRVKAGFEFYRPDFVIQVAVIPQRTYVAVEPTYVILVDRDEARLDATFRFKVRGAKTYQVEVHLPDWQIDSVEPESLIDLESFFGDTLTPLRIPLARATGGEVEIKIRARRRIVPGGEPIDLPLPSPVANAVAPPVVVIASAANVRLTPQVDRMPNYVEEPLSTGITLPAGFGTPLAYRVRGELATTPFVATVELEPQVVEVAMSGRATLDGRLARVEQTLAYSVAHERLDRLVLAVPATQAGANQLTVRHEGRVLPINWIAGDKPTDRRAEIRLPTPQLGTFNIVVEWTASLAAAEAAPGGDLRLELISPLATRIVRQTLEFVAPTDSQFMLAPGAWRIAPAEQGSLASDGHIAIAAADGPVAPIVFQVERRIQSSGVALTVEKAWVQSLLTRAGRQDRAAFRFTTTRPSVRVQLPQGVRTDDVDVLIDGLTPPRRTAIGEHELAIDLPPTPTANARVLELWYPFAVGRPGRGGMTLDAPQMVGTPWIRQVYWQVIVPDDEHLVFEPSAMTSENQWGWLRDFWGPSGQLDQAQLEQWVGATSQESPPRLTHRYLFSTTGGLSTLDMTTWDRKWLLLVAAGAVLAFGLAMIYVPVLRQPGWLFVPAVVVLALGFLHTALAILLAQAGLIGVVLALGAQLLDWFLVRRRGERPAPRPSHVHEARPTEGPVADRKPPSLVLPAANGGDGSGDSPLPLPSVSVEPSVRLAPPMPGTGSSHPTTATAVYAPPLTDEVS